MRRMRGFTMPEFAVIVLLVAIISAVLLTRYGELRRDAEQAAARSVLAALRVSLHAQMVRSGGDPSTLARLANENPVTWLQRPPSNYVGEMETLIPAAMAKDSWVFIKRDKMLVYLPSTDESFPFPSSRLLKFKVEFPHTLDRGGESVAMTATRGPGTDPVQAPAGH